MNTPINPPLTVAVGLSGGLDSAIAAYLLQQAGHQVIGLTMAIWDGSIPLSPKSASRPGCFGPGETEDLRAAEMLARRLDIPHAVIPLAEEYKRSVLDYFREEYRAGRTPNPCVKCNQTMKFGFLLESARKLGLSFDAFATGHYARLREDAASHEPLLRQALHSRKDQSYFLSRLSREQLGSVLFPLGEMDKEEVRKLAIDIGWGDFAAKPESQDFLECGDYTALFTPEESVPGEFVDEKGQVLGEHQGLIHYTIGQRKGLGLGGLAAPLFVVSIDAAKNRVVLGPKEALYTSRVSAARLNYLVDPASPLLDGPLLARLRLGHKGAQARIVSRKEDSVEVEFASPQLSATPGQVLALYADDGVVASGIISYRR